MKTIIDSILDCPMGIPCLGLIATICAMCAWVI